MMIHITNFDKPAFDNKVTTAFCIPIAGIKEGKKYFSNWEYPIKRTFF
jgi:hypothetical protein